MRSLERVATQKLATNDSQGGTVSEQIRLEADESDKLIEAMKEELHTRKNNADMKVAKMMKELKVEREKIANQEEVVQVFLDQRKRIYSLVDFNGQATPESIRAAQMKRRKFANAVPARSGTANLGTGQVATSRQVYSQPNDNHAQDEAIRKAMLNERVFRNHETYRHPDGVQEETIVFHQARALFDMTKLTQTFICERTSITKGALSYYLRGCYKGRQDVIEDKLAVFVADYLRGAHDIAARGRRK